jgi:hypothetical protein
MPKLFRTYLEDMLVKDDDCDDEEEIRSLGIVSGNEE